MKLRKRARKTLIVMLACILSLTMGVQFVNANAVDRLTIKIGYFGWPTSDYVTKAEFSASELYGMGTIKKNYSYWDGGKRVAIDSSVGVPLTTILDAAGLDQSSIAQMDFWTADSGNGAFTSFTWKQLLGTSRYYFKDLAACFEYEEEEPEAEELEDPGETEEPVTPDKPDKPSEPQEPEPEPEKPQPEPENKGEETSWLDNIVMNVYAAEPKLTCNTKKAWKNAVKVVPMMALEEQWVWYEVGTADATGTDNLGTSNRFRLNFGQTSPTEKRTFNSAKQVHTIYVMFSGSPKLSSKESDITGKVGSSHQLKVTAGAADEALEKKIESNIQWSTSDSSIATVDANGKVTFKKDGTVTITARSGGATKEFTVTVGDHNSGGSGTGDGTGGTTDDQKKPGENTNEREHKLEKVEVSKSNVFLLSDDASAALRSALNKTASSDKASMNIHQDEMDDDSSQLMVKKENDFFGLGVGVVGCLLAACGYAFGVMRFRKQRWNKLWK